MEWSSAPLLEAAAMPAPGRRGPAHEDVPERLETEAGMAPAAIRGAVLKAAEEASA